MADERGSKRHNSEGESRGAGGTSTQAQITMADMQSLFQSFSASLGSQIEAKIAESNGAIVEGMGQQYRRFEEQTETQFREAKEAIFQINDRVSKQAEQQRQLWDQIELISKQIAAHEQPRSPTFTTANLGFNRAIDPTIIAIRSSKEISREQAVAALEDMLG